MRQLPKTSDTHFMEWTQRRRNQLRDIDCTTTESKLSRETLEFPVSTLLHRFKCDMILEWKINSLHEVLDQYMHTSKI